MEKEGFVGGEEMKCKNCGHEVDYDQRVRNCLLHKHSNGVWISQACPECKCMKAELEKSGVVKGEKK